MTGRNGSLNDVLYSQLLFCLSAAQPPRSGQSLQTPAPPAAAAATAATVMFSLATAKWAASSDACSSCHRHDVQSGHRFLERELFEVERTLGDPEPK